MAPAPSAQPGPTPAEAQPVPVAACEIARVKAGRELRETLPAVIKLQSRCKTAEADQLLEAARAVGGRTATDARAGELRDLTFTFGNLELTEKVISKFLDMPEVKRLLPEHVRLSQKEHADLRTATVLLEAARGFFNEHLASNGRRNETDRNAFWAGLAALIPPDIFASRRGRAAMRILHLPYRTIKKAEAVRQEVEQKGGWTQMKAKPRSNRIDLELINEWWHTEAASNEDNQNKEATPVYHDGRAAAGSDEAAAQVHCDTHFRRYQLGSDKEALKEFHSSPQYAQLCRETATDNRPNGVQVGRKLLVKGRCPCIKVRRASECDCTICTFVILNLPLWHRARKLWLRASEAGCECEVCSSPLCELYWSCTSVRQQRSLWRGPPASGGRGGGDRGGIASHLK